MQSLTLPSGVVVGYTYTQDRLSWISLNGQTYISNIRYTPTGQVASWQWADGTRYQKTYDSGNKLKTFPLGIITRTLNYDVAGNIIGWDDNGDAAKAKQFSYDVLDRLEGYRAASETQAFQYDSNANRTAKITNGTTTLYGLQANSNRLIQVGSLPQTLDANGNLLQDGLHSYTYNAQNRLVSVDGSVAYTYNADEQRVKKASDKGSILYAWSDDRIIGEYDSVGTAQQETVYFGSTPIALVQKGVVYRIYADQIDTPRVVTDSVGKTMWAWDSSPFGETSPNEDPDQDGIALHYNQRFPGQIYDVETGLHYNFHRDYNPQTGRYVQSDPIGLEGGMNSFGYGEQTPLSLIDPDGKDAIRVVYMGYRIGIGIGRVPLFHAAIIALNQANGNTKYYEYGRYDSDFGQVKRRSISNVSMKWGFPTDASLISLFSRISKQWGRSSPISFTYYKGGDYNNVINFAEWVKNNPNRPSYNIAYNNCYTFATAAAIRGGFPVIGGKWFGGKIIWQP